MPFSISLFEAAWTESKVGLRGIRMYYKWMYNKQAPYTKSVEQQLDGVGG